MNKLEKVVSNNIDSVHYEKDNKILHVHFKNGHVYSYKDISLGAYSAFMTSPSKTAYLKTYIHKDNNHTKKKPEKK